MEQIKRTLRDQPWARWLVMVLISGLMFATYWFQDFFGGLFPLMRKHMDFTSEEFGRLIGLTTIANVFGMIIIGGMILDKWKVRVAGLVFGSLAGVGAGISALASAGFFGDNHGTVLTMMIVGRIMFGSGLEIVCVICTSTIVKWFKGYELALAMAINMGFGRLGSALGIAISPDIAKAAAVPPLDVPSVPAAVSFAATLIGIAMIMFLIYLIFDIKLERQRTEQFTEDKEDEFKFSDLFKIIRNPSFLYIALLCVSFYAAVFPFIQYAPDLLVNKFGFTRNLPEGSDILLFGNPVLGNAMIIVVIFLFGLDFALLPSKMKSMPWKVISIFLSLAFFGFFLYYFRDTLEVWLQNGPKTASLIPLGTILFTPIFGSYVDKKGRAASLMILGSLLLIFAHLALSLFDSRVLGYFGLLSLGIAFSLVPAAMWPSVAKIIEQTRLGTAYATMFTIQNWGLLLFFWGIGALLDFVNRDDLEAINKGEMFYDYTIPIAVLVVCGIISIFLAFKLKQADQRQRYGLELPSGETPD